MKLSASSHSFYFIRHGQTDWNKESRLMGQQDIPLNDCGIQQAHSAVIDLQGLGIERIYSSPLQRARMTAAILNASLKVPLVELKDLQECNWGGCEGKIFEGNELFQQWRQGIVPKGAESFKNFVKRVKEILEKILTISSNVLIVAHGGVDWAIQEILRIKEEIDIPNCVPALYRAISDHPICWNRATLL